MADDNEFQSRKERDKIIKNIEYQIEDEKKTVVARQEKEKTRLERARKREFLKEQERLEIAEKKQKSAGAEQQKKKKQQQEAREVMEQKRQSKMPKGKANVIKASTDGRLDSSTASAIASNIARDNVSTELYMDGKKVSERDLPQDLVKQIRKEQEKAIRQTENEINNSNNGIYSKDNTIGKDIESAQSKTKRDIINNKLRRNNGYTSAANNLDGDTSGSSTDSGLNRMPTFGVDVKNSKPIQVASGSYGSSGNGRRNISKNGIDIDDNVDTGNYGNTNNNGEGDILTPINLNTGNRDALKSDLVALNKPQNISGVENANNPSNSTANNNYSNHKGSSLNNTGIFLGAGAGISNSSRVNSIKKNMNASRGSSVQRGPDIDSRDLDAKLGNKIVSNIGKTSSMAGKTYKSAKRNG